MAKLTIRQLYPWLLLLFRLDKRTSNRCFLLFSNSASSICNQGICSPQLHWVYRSFCSQGPLSIRHSIIPASGPAATNKPIMLPLKLNSKLSPASCSTNIGTLTNPGRVLPPTVFANWDPTWIHWSFRLDRVKVTYLHHNRTDPIY